MNASMRNKVDRHSNSIDNKKRWLPNYVLTPIGNLKKLILFVSRMITQFSILPLTNMYFCTTRKRAHNA